MLIWDKNLKALKERDFDLFEKLRKKNAEIKEDEGLFFVEEAKDGEAIIGVTRKGRKKVLNSTYSPKHEAEQFIKIIPFTENAMIIFMGIGNGRILSTMLQELDQNSIVVIYEPDEQLFRFILEHIDISNIIKDERVVICVEELNGALLGTILATVMTERNVGISVVKTHPQYRSLYAKNYDKLKAEFEKGRESVFADLTTQVSKGKVMVKNVISNIPSFLNSKVCTDFAGEFPEDMPAIIVSGGPSLEKNWHLLKKVKGKAMIIALDRTARYLLERGIKPDVVCALDYGKPVVLFEDEKLKEIPFVYAPELNTEVMNKIGKEHLILARADYKLYTTLIDEQTKEQPWLPIGGSVATLAYGFAWSIGIKKIVLIGQDLALSSGKMYGEEWNYEKAPETKADTIMVPGNVEEMVETTRVFKSYIDWFERTISMRDESVEVINATEGGAKIEGTRIMTLQEVIDHYCINEYDVAAIFDSVDPIYPYDQKMEIYKELKKRGKKLPQLKNKAKEATELARRCRVLAERSDYTKEFKEKNKKLSKTGKLFEEDIMADLVNKYFAGQLAIQDIDLYVTEEDNQKEMIRLYKKLEYDYQIIYENIDEVIECYHNMLDKIKEEYGVEESC